MDNLIRDGAPLELFAWLDADAELPAWDRLKGCPFGAAPGALAGAAPPPAGALSTGQDYSAEYPLQSLKHRRCNPVPSRLHPPRPFATRIDADTYRSKHPARVYGKHQVRARTQGAYLCSFHDASWLDYLRLPHSLGFGALDEIAEHYWSGRTVEDIGLTFMNEPWREAPVIEALFQGALEAVSGAPRTAWLPGFA